MATSAAAAAVSTWATALKPWARVNSRHWDSACTWLRTVFTVSRLAPFAASSWWCTTWKCSAMMCRPESGSR